MNRVCFSVFLAFTLGLATASLAFAGNPLPARVQIQSDQAAGMVRFVIDGKTVMTLDVQGIKLYGNIEYSGTLTDGVSVSTPQKVKQP